MIPEEIDSSAMVPPRLRNHTGPVRVDQLQSFANEKWSRAKTWGPSRVT